MPSALAQSSLTIRRGFRRRFNDVYASKSVAKELAPLPSSWQHSVSDKDVAKPRAYSTLRMATLAYSVLHCDVPSASIS